MAGEFRRQEIAGRFDVALVPDALEKLRTAVSTSDMAATPFPGPAVCGPAPTPTSSVHPPPHSDKPRGVGPLASAGQSHPLASAGTGGGQAGGDITYGWLTG